MQIYTTRLLLYRIPSQKSIILYRNRKIDGFTPIFPIKQGVIADFCNKTTGLQEISGRQIDGERWRA